MKRLTVVKQKKQTNKQQGQKNPSFVVGYNLLPYKIERPVILFALLF